MKRIAFCILIVIAALTPGADMQAQLMRKAGELVHNVFDGSRADSASPAAVPAEVEEQRRHDSLRMAELERRLSEMQLNEMLLRSRLDNALNSANRADSLRTARRRQAIDSLRNVTSGVPVVLDDDTLLTIYASRGGYSAKDRADMITEALVKIGKDRSLRRDSLYMLENENFIDIMYGDRVLVSVTEQDALWHGKSMHEVASLYLPILDAKIKYLKNENSFWQILRRAGLFVLIIAVLCVIFKFINSLFRKLRRHIIRFRQQRLKPLVVRDYELLNTKRLCRILLLASNLVRYLVLLFLLILTVPVLFSIFPQTERLALQILHYILDPVKMVVRSIIEYIPNLFIILVIWYCVKYIIKGLHYIAREIEDEKLKISGFYPEWAQPTFNIIRFLLYAFMIAMIYPYLPGSESGVFQGISVFVGLIVSLGSSTVISNFIAGFVITYMRPFKMGDFIMVNQTTGNVIERTPFITRLRTIKNEVVTIPNSFIMTSDTVNYSASARKYGLIIHTMMTMGYDVPWRQVHQLLIDAALATPGVLEHPIPFVLETELNDNYMCYQLNAYIKDADAMPVIKSALLEHIQDLFHDAGIELVAPHYISTRDGNGSKLPPDRRPL